MKIIKLPSILLITTILVLKQTVVARDVSDITETARRIHEMKTEAIVWIAAVAEIQAHAGERTFPSNEQKFEAIGTVIDSSGLIVASLTQLDGSYEMSGRPIRTQSGRALLEAHLSHYKEIQIIRHDGSEVEGSVVLKDEDLDLIFIRADPDGVEDEDVIFDFIDFSRAAPASIVDPVVLADRLGPAMKRIPRVRVAHIAGILERPRVFYKTSLSNLRGPVFNQEGNVIGITVRRMHQGKPREPIVVPAETVWEVAQQARSKSRDD